MLIDIDLVLLLWWPDPNCLARTAVIELPAWLTAGLDYSVRITECAILKILRNLSKDYTFTIIKILEFQKFTLHN